MAKLEEYRRKRHFARTPEPAGKPVAQRGDLFVVQKHAARRLHYDFRLEIDGVLKSWAVPKGPSLNPGDKRLAVQTEDHPLEYGKFEGIIPEGNYGAGTVMVWDRGTYEVVGDDPARQLSRGELKFVLHGEKLRGGFALVKLRRSEKGNEWLLIKHKDPAVDPAWDIDQHDGSVLTGRTLDEIKQELPPSRPALAVRPEDLEGARKAAMPSRIEPMLATASGQPFSDPEWLFEVKWDGVRALSYVQDGKVEIRSRKDLVITSGYPELRDLPAHVAAKQAILDGEIAALDERGHGDFQKLQERMHVKAPLVPLLAKVPITYYVFDLLYCDGYDLREVPLIQRKQLLGRLLDGGDPVRYCDHVQEKGKELFELARQENLEGILAKRMQSPYVSGRSSYWLKLKARKELDAVVGGWTEPRAGRQHFGSLLLGLYNEKKLRFIGHAGSGFDQKKLTAIKDQLNALATPRCPFDSVPDTNEKAYWVKPALVARIQYSGWTQEERLRHPVFIGLREDANPEDCQLETEAVAAAEAPRQKTRKSGPEHCRVERPKNKTSGRLARVEAAEPDAAPDGATAEAPPMRPFIVKSPPLVGKILTDPAEIEAELFEGRADTANVEIDGKRMRLSHLNKVFFPESGYTKRHLLAYYYRIADLLLPFLKDRPLVMRRYPDGISGHSFFQKESGEAMPEWIETVAIPSEHAHGETRYVLAGDRAALLYLTNLGCIDHNPWSSRRDDLEHPDYFFFDLDPAEGTEFLRVVTLAAALHEKLVKLRVKAFVKTSGATGIHLYVPLERAYTYEQVRMFGEIVAQLVTAENRELVTQERVVAKRLPGKVLIDVTQNAYGRPLAAPYVVRAFPKAPVSTPIEARELRGDLRAEKLNIKTIFGRLEKRGDLWADFWSSRQKLEKLIDALGDGTAVPSKAKGKSKK